MTNEEALKELKQYFKIYMTQPFPEFANMAIDALEKRIPKKQTIDMRCPTCGHSVYNSAYRHCMDCGQAIDWTEEE